jgi:hypothetical protein
MRPCRLFSIDGGNPVRLMFPQNPWFRSMFRNPSFPSHPSRLLKNLPPLFSSGRVGTGRHKGTGWSARARRRNGRGRAPGRNEPGPGHAGRRTPNPGLALPPHRTGTPRAPADDVCRGHPPIAPRPGRSARQGRPAMARRNLSPACRQYGIAVAVGEGTLSRGGAALSTDFTTK